MTATVGSVGRAQFDVVSIASASRSRLLRAFPKIYSGGAARVRAHRGCGCGVLADVVRDVADLVEGAGIGVVGVRGSGGGAVASRARA